MKNKLGFDVISDDLFLQLFPGRSRATLSGDAQRRIEDHYANFGVKLPPTIPPYPDFDWKLPQLQGNDMLSHFEAMAEAFAGPYDKKISDLLRRGLPKPPTLSHVAKQAGWTRYQCVADGSYLVESVAHPLEDCFVFDCETFVKGGNFPIIATLASAEAWYIWLDPSMVKDVDYEPNLYPLGGGKLGIGHNVNFDSLRSVESHWLDVPVGQTRNYFFDTMSAHIVMSGYSGPQRWAGRVPNPPSWAKTGCPNSLLSCYNFYTFPEKPLTDGDKEVRNIFVDGTLEAIKAKLDDCLRYALLDVVYTFELFSVVYPRFHKKRPTWTALAGFLLQSAHNLPVVDDWFDWIDRVEAKLAEYEADIDATGRKMAEQIIAKFESLWPEYNLEAWKQHNEYLSVLQSGDTSKLPQAWLDLMLDPWLGVDQLKWEIKPRSKKLRGKPEWYRKLPDELGRANRYLHLLLKLVYRPDDIDDSHPGFPVIWAGQTLKWAYVRDGEVISVEKPGSDGEVGQVLLAKDFKEHFHTGRLVSSNGDIGRYALDRAMAVSYWVSCRQRVFSQIVAQSEYKTRDGITGTCNVIAPDLVPLGTVSGRGVSPLWLTVTDLSPSKRTKLGVELKSRIQAPPGKVLINGDMSAQELRLGANYADSLAPKAFYDDPRQAGYVGSSVMSYGVLAGNKEEGTDSHSQLAKAVGIDRNTAKVVAYALLYGAGLKTVANTIKSYFRSIGQNISYDYCLAKAREVMKLRKGHTESYDSFIYDGGTDSHCFTKLGHLASQPYPRTTILGNTLTAPLCPANVGRDFATGRTNWGIQSAARDQGDCIMVAFHWLCQQHGVNARIIFLIHDEYVGIVDECDKELAIWLLNVAHLWTWALTAERLEIYDMATEGLWFDDVIAQKALRKEATYSTQTPSNPDEVIPPGEVFTKWDLPKFNQMAIDRAPHLYSLRS